MIRILVVDDEALIRKGLVKLILNNFDNVEPILVAKDGNEALEIIREKKPNIVITDIKMPKLGGIELILKARELGYEAKFIILSGHSEFEYAKIALKNGVTDYLLKPIDDEELVDLVTKCINTIRNEENAVDAMEKRKKLAAECGLKLSLFSNDAKYEVYKQEVDALEKLFFGKETIALCIAIKDYREKDVKLNDLLEIYTDEFFKSVYEVDLCLIVYKPGIHYALIGREYIDNYDFEWIGKNFSKYIETQIGKQIYTGFSLKGKETKDCCEMAKQARLSILEHLYKEDSCCFIYNQFEQYNNRTLNNISKCSRNLINVILDSDYDKASKIIRCHIEDLISNNICPTIIEDDLQFMFLELKNEFKDENISSTINEYIGMIEYYVIILTKDKFIDSINIMLSKVVQSILSKDKWHARKIILHAKRYVEESDIKYITLQAVADYVRLSPSYFSSLFKQEMSQNFMNYVTDLRIKKAKKMLVSMPDYKVYEIAHACGYNDVKYFNRIFKQYTKYTPGLYRDKFEK